jgi:hypothetical protein
MVVMEASTGGGLFPEEGRFFPSFMRTDRCMNGKKNGTRTLFMIVSQERNGLFVIPAIKP